MKHHFSVVEEQDCTLASAVGAFLDCEHYTYLHKSLIPKMEVVRVQGRAVTYRQYLRFLCFNTTQEMTMEYHPPSHFSTYDVKASSWIPSIHHFISVKVDVDYSKHPERDTTIMRFDCELEIPAVLWPLRGLVQWALQTMHHQKDQQDLAAIQRRDRLFGRGNISALVAPHQFVLHKDDYVAHFAPELLRGSSSGSSGTLVPSR
jgi:hypothetical protein